MMFDFSLVADKETLSQEAPSIFSEYIKTEAFDWQVF